MEESPERCVKETGKSRDKRAEMDNGGNENKRIDKQQSKDKYLKVPKYLKVNFKWNHRLLIENVM